MFRINSRTRTYLLDLIGKRKKQAILDRCYLTRDMLYKYERGNVMGMTVPSLVELSKGLGVKPSEILEKEIEWLKIQGVISNDTKM